MSDESRESIEGRLAALAAEIKELPAPEKLRLAADLLEAQQPELAHQVIGHVHVELGAVLAIGRGKCA